VAQDRRMGDFLAILLVVAFTAAMLGLIWALERV
jgi:hypothetical protein